MNSRGGENVKRSVRHAQPYRLTATICTTHGRTPHAVLATARATAAPAPANNTAANVHCAWREKCHDQNTEYHLPDHLPLLLPFPALLISLPFPLCVCACERALVLVWATLCGILCYWAVTPVTPPPTHTFFHSHVRIHTRANRNGVTVTCSWSRLSRKWRWS